MKGEKTWQRSLRHQWAMFKAGHRFGFHCRPKFRNPWSWFYFMAKQPASVWNLTPPVLPREES